MTGVFPAQPLGFLVFRAAACVVDCLQYLRRDVPFALNPMSNYAKRGFVTRFNRA